MLIHECMHCSDGVNKTLANDGDSDHPLSTLLQQDGDSNHNLHLNLKP